MTDIYQWSKNHYTDDVVSSYYPSLINFDAGNTSQYTETDISRMIGLLTGISFSFKEGNLVPVITAIVVSRFMLNWKLVTFSKAA